VPGEPAFLLPTLQSGARQPKPRRSDETCVEWRSTAARALSFQGDYGSRNHLGFLGRELESAKQIFLLAEQHTKTAYHHVRTPF
jgi:hypothetical protein